ncbi:hypothetical protein U9M48_044114 [Paspalum notatum var. saurae]|uniref:Myb-like domain-containing protein n=1 Tax=Paspalum notatum var. saurae TaxID=547442 RepID=A0AAQ3UU80_PASNO
MVRSAARRGPPPAPSLCRPAAGAPSVARPPPSARATPAARRRLPPAPALCLPAPGAPSVTPPPPSARAPPAAGGGEEHAEPDRIMRSGRSATGAESSTLATGGTPWKGRLRSHHAPPTPTWKLASQTKNQDKKELQTLNKQAAPKKTAKGGQTRALLLAGRDSEHPIVINDEVNEEYKPRADQSAVKPLRRSPRLHPEDKSSSNLLLPQNCWEIVHNKRTKNAHREDKKQKSFKRNRRNAGLEPLAQSQNEPQPLCQDPQGIHPRKNIADVSNKNSGKQELKPSRCEVLTGKRKRGTERRAPLKKQSYERPKPLPAYCQEIAPCNEPRKSIHRRIEKNTIAVKPKNGDERLPTIDENIDGPSGAKREEMENFCGSDDWTKEQDMALRKAYFSARPSPHFWKRVSRMVPGRSAEDCFNRIHADLSTPTPIAPRPRTSKITFSPIGKLTLSDPKLSNLLEPTIGRQKTAKQKSLAAQKTVRHLLQKHCLNDQAQGADHFSIFESSPSALQLNISFEDSPGTPDSFLNSGSLGKCSGSSSARKKSFSRLRTKPSEPSPPVLKRIKNVILHEKYIDQLSRREGTRRHRKKAPGTKPADSGKTLSEQQAGGLKSAKNALISEATDFVNCFKRLQANSLAHVAENSEDDETGCDASDYSHDDRE